MEKLDVSVLPGYARTVMEGLCCAGYTAYYAGGCVRDILLGVVPGDVDIAASAMPEDVMRVFPHSVPTGIRHGTVTVCEAGGTVEVTTFRGEGNYSDLRHPDAVTFGVSPEEDVQRRDFTINALLCDAEGRVYDHVGGLADLAAGVIRAVGDARRRFSEDALRMLRALRFRAKTGFAIEKETEEALRELAPLAENLAAERVYDEIRKTLMTDRPAAVSEMLGYGLIPTFGRERLSPFAESVLAAARKETRCALLCVLLVREGRIGKPEDFAVCLKCERQTVKLAENILGAALAGCGTAEGARRMLAAAGPDGARAAALLCEHTDEVLAHIEGVLQRGEAWRADMLALRGGEIAALLCDATRTAEIRRWLLDRVILRPEDNTAERLAALIKETEK